MTDPGGVPTAAMAADPVVRGGWPLLRGRLKPPLSRSPLVPRPRLDALLEQCRDYEVTVVSAPAGFGKTTAVAQWFQALCERGLPAAWVSLDEMDSEPTRILMYLAASLSLARPSLSDRLSGLFDAGFESGTALVLRTVFNAVETLGEDVVLVVDDLHAGLEEDAKSIFHALVNHGLPNLHVILVLRDAPELPLARARMRNLLLEIGPLDLQFDLQETEAYFAAQQGVRIDREDLRLLHERTDGWIAALQLAVLSLRGVEDSRSFVHRFSGQHRDVADLLAEEVLARLSPEIVDFLEQSSVLSSFSAALCDELLGRDDSRDVIQRLDSGNFFIFNMDEEREFYRYHRLFAEYLRRNLALRAPHRIPQIHRAAAEWFRDHGLPVRACLHAARTDNPVFLAEILASVASALRDLGYGGTVMRYAAMLPPEIADRYPAMQLDRIYALTLSWRFDEARRVLEQVRASLTREEGAGDALYPLLLHREGQLALLTDKHRDAERLCHEWLEIEHQRNPFDEAVVRTSLIWSRAERYEFDGLERATDIRTTFEQPGMAWATVWHDSIIGSCFFGRGELARAEQLFRRALATASRLGGRLSATPAMPGLHLAELLYEKGELREARELVDDYLGIVTRIGMLGQLAAGYSTRARLLRIDGERESALKSLDEGCAVAERRGFRRLHHILMLERYQILLEQGNVERCFRIARADGLMSSLAHLSRDSQVDTLSEPQAFSWAAIGLARNRVDEAAELITQWRRILVSRGAIRGAIRFTVLGVRAAMLQGDRPRAVRLLREALAWSRDHGFVRSILDGGRPLVDLLETLETSDRELNPTRERLLRAAGVPVGEAPPEEPHRESGVEALNARETEILRLVEQGLMNKQIASDLGLTEGTVKWYMQQIFQKLDVRRRAQAIHKAKHLGLLR